MKNISKMSNDELIKNIESCEYECVAGNLKMNSVWIEMKNRLLKSNNK